MSKDSNDFYEKIRKVNEQNRLSSDSNEQDNHPNDTQEIAYDDLKNIFSLENSRAGILLLLWTVSPVLIGFISSEQMLVMLFCIYPLLSPLIWFLLAKWKPAGCLPTMILGSVGHVLLFFGTFERLSGEVGNSYFFGFEIIPLIIIAAIIILSAISSIFVILFSASRS